KEKLKYSLFSCLRAIYNPLFAWLAERYLQDFYDYEVKRLWSHPGGPPEWFDHRADLYRWSRLKVPFWVERGVFCREVMFQGWRVLDLCCGDGFYADHFYSGTASLIDAMDKDEKAISHARKWHNDPKIHFRCGDIVADEFPLREYDVVCWDAAIEH